MTTFTIRTIFPEQQRVEATNYDLEPNNEQGQAVCSLFLEFLSGQPNEFRAKIPFLNKFETELEWSAAPGGAALMNFYEAGSPLSLGILLSGVNSDSDSKMLDAMRQTVIAPVFGDATGKYMESPERPLLLNLIFPGNPEHAPRVQLLSAALASVFFRVMLRMHEQHREQQ